MECKKCGSKNEENSVFCNSCGTRLIPIVCRFCRAQNSSDAQFCSHCGKSFDEETIKREGTSVKPKEAEAKQVVYYNESVNSTALVWKIICMLGGLFGAAWGGYTIFQEKDRWLYTYTSPYTEHESTMILIVVVSIIIFIIGCLISTDD